MDSLADMIDMSLKVKMLIHKKTKIFHNIRVFSISRINDDVWQIIKLTEHGLFANLQGLLAVTSDILTPNRHSL